jgi:hypothetical protein
MDYQVYLTPGGAVGTVQGDMELPEGASSLGSTDNCVEAHEMVITVTLGLRGRGGGVPRCGQCRMPAWPDGEGGWDHAEPADGAFCGLVFGGVTA